MHRTTAAAAYLRIPPYNKYLPKHLSLWNRQPIRCTWPCIGTIERHLHSTAESRGRRVVEIDDENGVWGRVILPETYDHAMDWVEAEDGDGGYSAYADHDDEHCGVLLDKEVERERPRSLELVTTATATVESDLQPPEEQDVLKRVLQELAIQRRKSSRQSIRSVEDTERIVLMLNKLRGERELFRLFRDRYSFNKVMWKKSWDSFTEYLVDALEGQNSKTRIAMERAIHSRDEIDFAWTLYMSRTMDMFEDKILSQEHSLASELTDLTNPHELYPEARKMQRKIIFHVGPTNSGKTHNAFQRLFTAKSGIYAAPLRLLAAEGFNKMRDNGLAANLITGDHKIITSEDATHISCTVEMAALNAPVDVTVVDEIQMAADADRGWAWTRALLGIRSKEIHICGEERAIQVMNDICEEMGEDIEVRDYKRLTKLTIMDESIDENLRKLRKGDCVITFSRNNIFKLKAQIERYTKFKCAVVFGGLPPESRLEQARLFNEPDSKYDILLATDAIGYGLNLNIGRIVFHTLRKFDGIEERYLEPAQIRQIAGRAGRFGTRFPNGEVTCFKQSDCARVNAAFHPDAVSDLMQVGLRPSVEQLEYFAEHHTESHKLSELIEKFEKLTTCSDNYFVCNSDDAKKIADLLHELDMPFEDRVTFTHVPVDTDEPYAMHMLHSWSKRYSEGREVNIFVDIPDNLPKTATQLKELELQYKVLEAYCWLSFRYPEFFCERRLAEKKKRKCQKMIDESLKDPALLKEFEARRKKRKGKRNRSGDQVLLSERQARRRMRDTHRFNIEKSMLRRRLAELGL